MITPLQLAAAGLIVFAACFLQGMVGFGAGLLSISTLTLIGLPVPVAISINLITSGAQSAWGAHCLRDKLVVHDAWQPILLRLAAMPLGVLTLWWVDALHPDAVKQMLGAILLLIVVVHWCWKIQPRDHLHIVWQWIAFPLSGWMMGFCGMGGPPMVLWVMAHRWSNQRARAFLFLAFCTGAIPLAFCLWWAYRQVVLKGFFVGLIAMPLAWLGTYWGLQLGSKLPTSRLRAISYALLATIAISVLTQPLLAQR